MDYEKKYNEALEIARQIHNGNPSSGTAIVVCEQIFPELRKSEDERMRKRAIAILKQQRDYYSYDGPIDKFPPATPRKALVDAIDVALSYLEKQNEPKHAPDDLQKSFEAGQTSILDNPEQYGLCKKAEWSEEDEEMKNDILDLLDSNIAASDYHEIEDWLNALPNRISLRPSWKPSEEEMKALDVACSGKLWYGEIYLNGLRRIREQLKKL